MTRDKAEKTDLALEKHYTITEIADLWGLSEKTTRKLFENEEGVLSWGREEKIGKRGYRSMRVPQSVMIRIHHRTRLA